MKKINAQLYCANLGDSRALLARKMHDTWHAVALSRDHKPNDPPEHDRIISCGGRIEPFRDQLGNHIGPMRVWTRHENVPGLAMSRSMGDLVAASVGVSQDPEIKEFTLT
jgi:serine/threonine protein phosphatase PrpC